MLASFFDCLPFVSLSAYLNTNLHAALLEPKSTLLSFSDAKVQACNLKPLSTVVYSGFNIRWPTVLPT